MKPLLHRTLFCLALFSLFSCTHQTETLFSQSEQPERLFLQQLTDSSVIIKWRGDANTACILSSDIKQRCADASATQANHKEVAFKNLAANTFYQYSVGDYRDSSLKFRTAPITGSTPEDGKTRLWILGDSGSAIVTEEEGEKSHAGEAKAVMDGFSQYNAKQIDNHLDLILLLGDNAYWEGTDQQWQIAVFDLYRPLISQSPLFPTIGNHEMGAEIIEIPDRGKVTWGGISTSSSPDSFWSIDNETRRTMPYLDIFTLPTQGEAGGVASGTEQYYSQDYGNIHIVSLDSQLSARDETQRKTMREWLINDLSSNNLDWTIVIFHHPPYTKGSHDSDTAMASRFGVDQPIIDMREEFTEIFEDYAVDMVYSGHSHTYERSYYLNGHRGDADTFDPALHAELGVEGALLTGRKGQSYQQVSPSTKLDDKVVYTVAGSAGKVDVGDGKLDHPAHAIQPQDPEKRHGLLELGSVVVEATKNSLSAYFIDTQGQVLDDVTITR